MTPADARALFPVLERVAYLNAGTFGPLARPTAEAVRRQLDSDLECGRMGAAYFERLLALRSEARAAIAALVGAEPSRVALTGSTTVGCNIVLAGLVLGPEAEPGKDDVAAVRRRAGQRDLLGRGSDEEGNRGAHLRPQLEQPLEVRLAEAAALEVGVQLTPLGRPTAEAVRPERARVQVRDPLEHGKERARLARSHPIVTSTGAWSESTSPSCRRRSSGQAVSGDVARPRTRTWSIPGPSADQPGSSCR